MGAPTPPVLTPKPACTLVPVLKWGQHLHCSVRVRTEHGPEPAVRTEHPAAKSCVSWALRPARVRFRRSYERAGGTVRVLWPRGPYFHYSPQCSGLSVTPNSSNRRNRDRLEGAGYWSSDSTNPHGRVYCIFIFTLFVGKILLFLPDGGYTASLIM